MSYQERTNDELVALLVQSDEKAFEELYYRYWSRIFRYAITKVSHQEAAEDICHEVFLSLWQRRQTLQIQNAEAYLIQATKYSVITYYKSKSSDEKHLSRYAQTQAEVHNETEYTLFFNNLQQSWLQALTNLPQKTQDVFRASRIEHLSNKEIATRFDVTEKAVEYHITKALRQIREQLKEFFLLLLLLTKFF